VARIPEQVVEGRTGFLVPPADPASMADAVARLLNDDRLRRRMAGDAADDARGRFGLDRQADNYLGWYQEILERRRSTSPGH
jgi:glycosyltransferase involved in cell wall biosynthesis